MAHWRKPGWQIDVNFIALLLLAATATAFQGMPISDTRSSRSAIFSALFSQKDESMDAMDASNSVPDISRRDALGLSILGATTLLSSTPVRAEEENMFAPKFVQEYSTFTQTSEGWSYRDVNVGSGLEPQQGDRVVFEWSGYTIGYFGRPFEARKGPQGGAFDKEQDYSRTVLGSGQMVKGLECGFSGMKVGGIRQILVPYGDLGYPANDPSHEKVGPKPSTFSGQRALNFVLENPRVDRTLLFNVKLVRVDKPNGKGGFVRG